VTPPVDAGGEALTFRLTVTDTGGLEDSDNVDVTIEDNGITDFDSVNPDAITFTFSTGENMGLYVESGGDCTFLNVVDPSTIPDSGDKPENLVYGLIDMQIKVAIPGSTATAKIYLPTPAPAGYRWYKYSPTNGWSDYSANTQFNATRDEVTLTLTDGGVGDDDLVANGMIADPSGLGSVPASDPLIDVEENPSSAASGGGGNGCFVRTAIFPSRIAN
jgi:hypothetical protein